MLENGFIRGSIDITLFTKKDNKNLLIIQIYVDGIIFGAINEYLCKKFVKLMQREFEMSMMDELKFFLGLQIKQMKEGIFINQSKYIKEILKKFGLKDSKSLGIYMSSVCKLDKDEC